MGMILARDKTPIRTRDIAMSTRRCIFQVRAPSGIRNLSRVAALVFAACTYLAPTAPASATPITYMLSDATATFGSSGADTLTGTFTVDYSAETLDAVDIVISGPVDHTTIT